MEPNHQNHHLNSSPNPSKQFQSHKASNNHTTLDEDRGNGQTVNLSKQQKSQQSKKQQSNQQQLDQENTCRQTFIKACRWLTDRLGCTEAEPIKQNQKIDKTQQVLHPQNNSQSEEEPSFVNQCQIELQTISIQENQSAICDKNKQNHQDHDQGDYKTQSQNQNQHQTQKQSKNNETQQNSRHSHKPGHVKEHAKEEPKNNREGSNCNPNPINQDSNQDNNQNGQEGGHSQKSKPIQKNDPIQNPKKANSSPKKRTQKQKILKCECRVGDCSTKNCGCFRKGQKCSKSCGCLNCTNYDKQKNPQDFLNQILQEDTGLKENQIVAENNHGQIETESEVHWNAKIPEVSLSPKEQKPQSKEPYQQTPPKKQSKTKKSTPNTDSTQPNSQASKKRANIQTKSTRRKGKQQSHNVKKEQQNHSKKCQSQADQCKKCSDCPGDVLSGLQQFDCSFKQCQNRVKPRKDDKFDDCFQDPDDNSWKNVHQRGLNVEDESFQVEGDNLEMKKEGIISLQEMEMREFQEKVMASMDGQQ